MFSSYANGMKSPLRNLSKMLHGSYIFFTSLLNRFQSDIIRPAVTDAESFKLQMVGISPGSAGRVYHILSSNVCSAVSWQRQRRNCRSFHHLCTTGNLIIFIWTYIQIGGLWLCKVRR